jgi:ABC-type multidrug transport system fused ATPase/permease subunit
LFLWVVRDVLLAFGDAVSPMSLVTAAATVGGIWILRSGCTYVGEVSQYRLAYKAEIDSVHQVLAKLLAMPIRLFDRSSEGDIVIAAYQDLQGVRMVILQVGTMAMTLSRLGGLAAAAWLMSPKLALIAFVAVPVGVLPTFWLGQRIRKAARRQRAEMVTLHDVFLQASSGIRMIKVSEAAVRVR